MRWILVLTVTAAVVSAAIIAGKKAVADRVRSIRRGMQRRYGDRIRLIAGCGVVGRAGRVPGIVALAEGLLAYETIYPRARGEIALASVKKYELEDASGTKHLSARSSVDASVLALYADGGDPQVFVLPAMRAGEWRAALRTALGEPAPA